MAVYTTHSDTYVPPGHTHTRTHAHMRTHTHTHTYSSPYSSCRCLVCVLVAIVYTHTTLFLPHSRTLEMFMVSPACVSGSFLSQWVYLCALSETPNCSYLHRRTYAHTRTHTHTHAHTHTHTHKHTHAHTHTHTPQTHTHTPTPTVTPLCCRDHFSTCATQSGVDMKEAKQGFSIIASLYTQAEVRGQVGRSRVKGHTTGHIYCHSQLGQNSMCTSVQIVT